MHGWKVGKAPSKGGIRVHPPDNSKRNGMTLNEVQALLWVSPHLMFSQYFSTIGEDTFRAALRLSAKEALATELEPSSPEVEGMSRLQRDKLLAELDELCPNIAEEKVPVHISSSPHRQRLHDILLQFGWKHEVAESWTDKWWRWEKVYMPPTSSVEGEIVFVLLT